MNFNYFLPVNIVFGCGRVSETGQLTKPTEHVPSSSPAEAAPKNPVCTTVSKTACMQPALTPCSLTKCSRIP